MAQVQELAVMKVMKDIHMANTISSQFDSNNDDGNMSNSDSNTSSIIPSEYQKALSSDYNYTNDDSYHIEIGHKPFHPQPQYRSMQNEKKEENNHFNFRAMGYNIVKFKGYETSFKCPNNHSLRTFPYGFGQCEKCHQDLSKRPCRHCNTCNYVVCLQCHKVSASNCSGGHGLIQYIPESKYELNPCFLCF